VAVHAAMCGSAAVCSSASDSQTVCGCVCGSMQHCEWQCVAMRQWVALRQSVAVRAAVCDSSAT
jgi:hypothetical protein